MTAPPPPESSRGLPELERPAQRKGPGFRVLMLGGAVGVVCLGVVLFGIPGVSKSVQGLFAASKANVLTFKVSRGKLPVTVKERGNLESSQNEDVHCEVEGQTSIISILPEGTRVTKGMVVAELDSSALKDNLVNQEITTKGAEAAYQNARLTREVAEIAVKEYVEGVYRQDKLTAENEIKLAESDLTRALDRKTWATRMELKGYISKAQRISEDLNAQRAKVALEQAQTKLDVLERYTKDKTIKELQSEVEKAKSDELAKSATWELEKSKEAKLRKQIEKCVLKAPSDGLVVYANDPNRFGGSQQPQIEEGAMVRERQKIFSLPDINHMRVNTKVHESMIDRVSRGLRARIQVDAFPNEVLGGAVESVNPLPDQTSFFSSDIKVYTTLVTIENGLSGLRPGMTAQVTILVTELENVVSVPVQGVLQVKGKDYVFVKGPDGFTRTPVTLGISNDQLIEVKQGLKPGEDVALDPMGLLSEEEKQEFFGAGSSADGKSSKDWGVGKPAGAPVVVPGGPAAGPGGPAGPDGKGKAKGKGAGGAGKAKGKRGAGGGFGGGTPEDRQKFMQASPEEKRKILEGRGMTPEQIDALLERMSSGGGGGGGFGGPGGGGGGGGFRGGPPGGGAPQ
jgi:HlyD family secretion protein